MIGNGARGNFMMNPVIQSNYSMDVLNLNPRYVFKAGDMVQQPDTGHIGILLAQEPDRTGFCLVEWIMSSKGRLLKRRLQTYEYDRSLDLYAKAEEA